jgi:hypothetical protein
MTKFSVPSTVSRVPGRNVHNAVKNANNTFPHRTAESSAAKAASPPFTHHVPSAAEKRKKWCRCKMLLIVPQPIA